ncbi:MAG: DUF1858 domain-containing protein [Deferribacterota bacterium]|nr:DUF1858 domain-containing protein [Deferribacterota bacterium]
MKIDKNQTIAMILKNCPKSIKVFEKFNMGCASCLGIENETLEMGAIMHGIDVDELIKELNEACK